MVLRRFRLPTLNINIYCIPVHTGSPLKRHAVDSEAEETEDADASNEEEEIDEAANEAAEETEDAEAVDHTDTSTEWEEVDEAAYEARRMPRLLSTLMHIMKGGRG
jgi:hypothetical protein